MAFLRYAAMVGLLVLGPLDGPAGDSTGWPSPAHAQAAHWLDGPIAQWNQARAALPAPPAASETPGDLARRCPPAVAAEATPAEAAVARAGWAPFLHLDRRIVRDDIEIVGGRVAATSSCEPSAFQVFVFVGGAFAGTLSPTAMVSRSDGAAGAVRIADRDTITVEFARYGPASSECCPSSVVRVTYRIERSGGGATIAAVDVRPVR